MASERCINQGPRLAGICKGGVCGLAEQQAAHLCSIKEPVSDEQVEQMEGAYMHTSRWPPAAAATRAAESLASARAGWAGWLSSRWQTCAAQGSELGGRDGQTQSTHTSKSPFCAATLSAWQPLSDALAGWTCCGLRNSLRTALVYSLQ